MKTRLSTTALATALVLLLIANVMWGSESMTLAQVMDSLATGRQQWVSILMGQPQGEWNIIWESRIPQAVTALLCGAALGTGGLILQTLLRNPLAGPSILGIDSGAHLGVAIVMLLLGGSATLAGLSLDGQLLVVVAALVGASLIMALLIALSSLLRSAVMLLVTGVIISYLTGSIISLLNFSASKDGVHRFILWGMGSFTALSLDRMPLYIALITTGLMLALLMTKSLDALLLGDNYARNLGIGIRRTRTLLLLSTGLLTATTTAYCGPVSFIGLAVPHLGRLVCGRASHRILLPVTMMMGAALALLCNLLSTTLPTSGTLIPINVLTPIIGAPVILWVIFRRKSY